MLSIATIETFSQTGFNHALIQKKEDINSYLDTAWTFSVIRGIFLFLILFVSAPLIAKFFNSEQVISVIRVIAISTLIIGFKNIGVLFFLKKLEFNKQFIYELSVFTHQGNSFSKGGIKRSFRTACKKANVPYDRKTDNGITFHDIRRTVKTHLLYAGVDKARRDAIVGHSLKGMDAHYIVLSDESLKEAMDQYTVWLDEKIDEADRLLKEAAEESKSNPG